MTLDMTAFDPMLKDHYAPGEVANMAMQNNKWLGSVKKSNRRPVGGKKWVQPIQFGLPGGGSSTFATAIAATSNESQYEAFEVTRTKHYRRVLVDNETIEASATGDVDAFEPAFDEFDNAIKAEANYMEFRAFRTRGGYIGRITNSSLATTVGTMDDAAACFGVRKGDVLKTSATDGLSGSVRVGSVTVASVQRSAGTITTTANWSTGITSPAQNDYVFLDGDFGLAAAGMGDWVADTAPSATAFYAVDRSIEPEYLGGCRVDGTDGRPAHEVFVDMVVQVDNLGGDVDIIWANPRQCGQLTKQLEGKWSIVQAADFSGKKMASIGYKGWTVNIEGHEVTIMTNRCCPVNRSWAVDSESWTLFSAGPAPNFLQKRAGSIIKVAESSDAYEARVGEYWNIANKAPGHNCNGKFNSPS